MVSVSHKALKAELIRLLIEEEAIGESQCKTHRAVQCANIPQHKYGDAKDAIGEMISSRDVPVFSKGGGERGVIHISSSRVQEAKEFANEYHPERDIGDSFDRTDISSGTDDVEMIFTTGYEHKKTVWRVLENADVGFEHRHGGETSKVPSDKIIFKVEDHPETIEEVRDELQENTSGGITLHDYPEEKQKTKVPA